MRRAEVTFGNVQKIEPRSAEIFIPSSQRIDNTQLRLVTLNGKPVDISQTLVQCFIPKSPSGKELSLWNRL